MRNSNPSSNGVSNSDFYGNFSESEKDEILVNSQKIPIHRLIQKHNVEKPRFKNNGTDDIYTRIGEPVEIHSSKYILQKNTIKAVFGNFHYRILWESKENGIIEINESCNREFCESFFNTLKRFKNRLDNQINKKNENNDASASELVPNNETTNKSSNNIATTTTTTTTTTATTNFNYQNNISSLQYFSMSDSEIISDINEQKIRNRDRYAIIIGGSVSSELDLKILGCIKKFCKRLEENSFNIVLSYKDSVGELQEKWDNFLTTIRSHPNNLDIIVFVTGTCYSNGNGDLVCNPCKDLNQATFIKDMATRLKENVNHPDSNTLFIIDAKRTDNDNSNFNSPNSAEDSFKCFGGGGIAFLLPCYQGHVCYFTMLFCKVLKKKKEYTLIQICDQVQIIHGRNVAGNKTTVNLTKLPHYGDLSVGSLVIVEIQ